MSAIDVARILESVTPERPCGADLEYDAEYLAMMQAATPKPERQMGAEVIAAEEPNWPEVKQLATRLLARSKDLRVLLPLCRSLLHTDGIGAFATGLQALRGMLDQFWAGLFPQLDADDNNDPTMRVNALLGLVDNAGMLKSLREVPLVRARAAGNFALRDIDAAAGRGTVSGTPPTPDLIRAAFQEVEVDSIETTLAAVRQAREDLRGIDSALANLLGDRAPNLRPLANVLGSQARELEQQLQARGGGRSVANPGEQPAAGSAGNTPAERGAASGRDGVQSRDDVLRLLDLICEFYARSEPSSPVPMLLQRARRLVNKSFLDVVRDLVPEGLNQANLFRGAQEES